MGYKAPLEDIDFTLNHVVDLAAVAKLRPAATKPCVRAMPIGPGRVAFGLCVPQPAAPYLLAKSLSARRRPTIGTVAIGMSTATDTEKRSPAGIRRRAASSSVAGSGEEPRWLVLHDGCPPMKLA